MQIGIERQNSSNCALDTKADVDSLSGSTNIKIIVIIILDKLSLENIYKTRSKVFELYEMSTSYKHNKKLKNIIHVNLISQ